jgi:hypothetical protein
MGPGELFKAKNSFLSFRFDLIASLPLLNKDTVDMAVWRMLALLAASKQWHCIGFKQDSIDAADLLAWIRHCTVQASIA